MMRGVARIGAVALVAVVALELLAWSVGAVPAQSKGDQQLIVEFDARGDLASMQGFVRYRNCVQSLHPDPVRVESNRYTRVDMLTVWDTPCVSRQEVNWSFKTEPKAARDLPETMDVRLTLDREGAIRVEFLQASKDLRWKSQVLDKHHVRIEITGK